MAVRQTILMNNQSLKSTRCVHEKDVNNKCKDLQASQKNDGTYNEKVCIFIKANEGTLTDMKLSMKQRNDTSQKKLHKTDAYMVTYQTMQVHNQLKVLI